MERVCENNKYIELKFSSLETNAWRSLGNVFYGQIIISTHYSVKQYDIQKYDIFYMYDG